MPDNQEPTLPPRPQSGDALDTDLIFRYFRGCYLRAVACFTAEARAVPEAFLKLDLLVLSALAESQSASSDEQKREALIDCWGKVVRASYVAHDVLAGLYLDLLKPHIGAPEFMGHHWGDFPYEQAKQEFDALTAEVTQIRVQGRDELDAWEQNRQTQSLPGLHLEPLLAINQRAENLLGKIDLDKALAMPQPPEEPETPTRRDFISILLWWVIGLVGAGVARASWNLATASDRPGQENPQPNSAQASIQEATK